MKTRPLKLKTPCCSTALPIKITKRPNNGGISADTEVICQACELSWDVTVSPSATGSDVRGWNVEWKLQLYVEEEP